MPTWQDIEQARERLSGVAHRTPVLTSRQFDEACGATVFFKAENLQRGGAFKFRGAYNKIKAETERRAVSAVVAFSSGNHAQAVALVSRMLGIRATIVMPKDAPKAKIEATRGYGAEVVLYDRATAEPRRPGRGDLPRARRRADSALRRRAHHGRPGDRAPWSSSRTFPISTRSSCRCRAVAFSADGRRPRVSSSPRSRSMARNPRPPRTRSSRSPPATGSRSRKTRRSPTGCA